MRLADGVLLVVDAAEGALVVTEKVVKQALAEGLPITLLLTKARPAPGPSVHTLCDITGDVREGCRV